MRAAALTNTQKQLSCAKITLFKTKALAAAAPGGGTAAARPPGL